MDADLFSRRIVQKSVSSRQHQLRRKHASRERKGLVFETALKLACNLLLSGGTVFALLQLWPYHQSQQENLRHVESALKEAEFSTHQVRVDFNRYFDASQAYILMQEQSGLMDPRQRPVFLLEPSAED